jgi:hypothetical protein
MGHNVPHTSWKPTMQCAECGCAAPLDAQRGKAEIGDDLREDDPPEVVLFCPECWEREFGG